MRPVSKRERENAGEDMASCVSFPNDGEINVASGRKEKTFEYDQVFNVDSKQSDVYEEISGLVTSVLDGYNVCIFAYGQTGSGKTFTMQGGTDPATWGLIPRALSKILETSEGMRADGWQWTLTASFLEIYNEQLRDLLHDAKKDGQAPSYGAHPP